MGNRPKLLVSACLLGRPVRYDGTAKTLSDHILDRWVREGRVVPVCPELSAGLPTPRPAAEIANGQSGESVLSGSAIVVAANGDDVTEAYVAGARAALGLAMGQDCRFALLTDGSPSCGGSFIHDGSFGGQRHSGEGVAAALLRQHGIKVFSPHQITELAALID